MANLTGVTQLTSMQPRPRDAMLALGEIFADVIEAGPGTERRKDISRRLWATTGEVLAVLDELRTVGREGLAAKEATS